MAAHQDNLGLHRVGCVSFLNSMSLLIEPLVGRGMCGCISQVPSKLMGLVEGGVVVDGVDERGGLSR